jgi:hypothetical protein
MNSRDIITFFKSKTGQLTAFGLVFFVGACLLTGVLYFRHSTSATTPVATPAHEKAVDKTPNPSTWFSGKPDADYANRHPLQLSYDGSTNRAPVAPAVLPISLYHGDDRETDVSDTYAPYGRMIPCETVITIDSAKIETPIIGFVTEDVWHDGRLIIPAGAVGLMARREGPDRREKSPAIPPLALGWPNRPEKAAIAPPSSASTNSISRTYDSTSTRQR